MDKTDDELAVDAARVESSWKERKMSEELKACPFCGKPAVLWFKATPYGDMVCCNNPACQLCQQAIRVDRWQHRPLEDAQAVRIKELEARIMELKIEWATLVNHMANFALDGNLSSNDRDECEDAIQEALPYLGG